MEESHVLEERPHAICLPMAAQGHIKPMLKLARLLHSHGYFITFVLTEFDYSRLLRSNGPDSLRAPSDDFKFETIPDGLPPPPDDDYGRNRDPPSLCDSLGRNGMTPFRDLVMRLQRPRVSLVVWDGMLRFAQEVAAELGVADVMFWTASAGSLMGYLHYPHLIQRGLTPLKDESCLTNGYLNAEVDWIPGMKGLRLKDIPTFFQTTNPNDILFNFMMDAAQWSSKASAIIINTFLELEQEVLLAMAQILPPIYTIGPLSMLCKHIPNSTAIASIASSLWKEDTACIDWLGKMEPRSVVYVNFGSITNLSMEQLLEFAWGLADSNQFLLWVIRPDLVSGEKAILPEDFAKATSGRCLVVDWCPQEQVLVHPSTGAFLTHSGWNSILEGICAGVPMICWSFFADQSTNCYYACKKWGIGLQINDDVKREDVKSLVKEVMEEEKGNDLRKKAMEWKERAAKAVDEGGTSSLNIRKLFEDFI